MQAKTTKAKTGELNTSSKRGGRTAKLFAIDLNNFVGIRSIRSGLVSLIPVLLVGALALLVRSFFMTEDEALSVASAAGIAYSISSIVYFATFGMLSIYATLTIARAYVLESGSGQEYINGALLSSATCFAILAGVLTGDFTIESFSTKGMFLALISGLGASWAYIRLTSLPRKNVVLSSGGADDAFVHALRSFLPILAIVLVCAMFELVIVSLFGTGNLYELFVTSVVSLFEQLGRTVFSGLFFVVTSSLLWFFGIHGSNVFEGAVVLQFTPAIDINQAAIAAGQAPTEILTKTFFDSFVLMGGCGSAWCLVLALILFSKRPGIRLLSRVAAIPMVFNVNEIVIFGLPIVFNPWLLIPFVAVPTVNYLCAYAATAVGLVPVTTTAVEWTTPIFINGWIATGSPAGAILQLCLLVLGTAIYAPFVKHYNEHLENEEQERLEHLVARLRDSEQTLVPVTLTDLAGDSGAFARSLSAELRSALSKEELTLAFQPQFDEQGRCLGAEALLRWAHPRLGNIYPPLIVKLADEGKFLFSMESYILERACETLVRVRNEQVFKSSGVMKTSVNVCPPTLQNPEYVRLVDKLIDRFSIQPRELCLEITEQIALDEDAYTQEAITRLRARGVLFAIDDFSMGHTSLKYLQSGHFDWVKLDGSLVTNLPDDESAVSIVESVVHLSHSMGFSVIAEFVETEEQRAALENIGCTCYQGYLFSAALPIDECLKQVESIQAEHV